MRPHLPMETLIQQARLAVRRDAGRAPDWFHVTGSGENLGVAARYSLLFGAHGAFAIHADGPFHTGCGFDGSRGWLQDSTGLSRLMEEPEVAVWRLVADVLSGAWTTLPPEAFLDARQDVQAGTFLVIDPGGTAGPATVELDPESMLCRALVCQRAYGLETWRLEFGESRDFPNHIEQILPGGFRNWIDVQSVSPASPLDRQLCVVPEGRAEDPVWNPTASPDLRVQRVGGGFLTAPVRINGTEERTFVIDSGAAVNVIDRKIAEAGSLQQIGRSWMPSTSGSGPARRWCADSLEAGPLTLHNVWFTELDMTMLSSVSGVEIGGILGYDIFMRSVVELDLQKPSMALFEPALYPRQEKHWLPLSLYSNRPHVVCRFGVPTGGTDEGLFRLDIGAPKVSVLFNAPVTARHSLASGPGMNSVKIPLPGGEMETAVGPIPWFEFGGEKTENVRSICVVSQGTGFADPAVAGNLGQVLLVNRRLVFDYRNAGIAIA